MQYFVLGLLLDFTFQEAGEIIECAYNDYANAVQRQALIQEFYGPSFALFKVICFLHDYANK